MRLPVTRPLTRLTDSPAGLSWPLQAASCGAGVRCKPRRDSFQLEEMLAVSYHPCGWFLALRFQAGWGMCLCKSIQASSLDVKAHFSLNLTGLPDISRLNDLPNDD